MGVNQYAINLDLNLKDSAGPVLTGVLDTLDQIQTGIDDIAKLQPALDTFASDMSTSMLSAATTTEKMADATTELTKMHEDDITQLKQINDAHEDMSDIYKEQLDSVEKIEDHLDQFRDEKFPVINDYAEEFRDITRETADHAGDASSGFDRTAASVFNLGSAFAYLRDTLVQAFQEEENFVTANYRLYGSMQQLGQATRNIALDYNATRGEAIEAYKAMVNVKAPREEIEKLAGTTAEYSRVTGIGMEKLAEFEFKTRMLERGAKGYREQLVRLSNVMRGYGMNAQDASGILDVHADKTLTLTTIFGKDMVPEIQAASEEFAGFAKVAGTDSVEAAHLFQSAMQGSASEAGLVAQAALGIKGDLASIDDQSERTRLFLEGLNETAVRGFGDNAAAVAEFKKTGKVPEGMALEWHAYMDDVAGQMGVQGETLKRLAITTNEYGVDSVDAIRLASDAMKDMRTDEEILAEANQNIARQWVKLWDDIRTTMMSVLVALEPAIRVVIAVIRKMADGLIWLAQAFGFAETAGGGMTGWLETLAAPFSAIGDFFVRMYEDPLAALGSIWKFVGGLIALAIVIGIGTVAFRMLSGAMESLNTGKLLALAALVLAVGVSMMLMAVAVTMVAEAGWAGAAALIMLTVALIAITGGLIAIAVVGGVTLPVLAGIALVLLAVGLAALMTGYGISLMVESIKGLTIESAIAGGILMLFAIAFAAAAGLVFSGALLLVAAAPLIVLGAWVLGYIIDSLAEKEDALTTAATGLNTLAEAMAKLVAGGNAITTLQETVTSIMDAVDGMIAAMETSLQVVSDYFNGLSSIILGAVFKISVGFVLLNALITKATIGLAMRVAGYVSLAAMAYDIAISQAIYMIQMASARLSLFMRIENILYAASFRVITASKLLSWAIFYGVISAISSAAMMVESSTGRIKFAFDEMITVITHAASGLGGIGMATWEELDFIANTFEMYASKMEQAAARVWQSVFMVARPAIVAASVFGLDDLIRTETVATVKVMQGDDYKASLQKDEENRNRRQQVAKLQEISDKMDNMGVGGTEKILALLATYLPMLAENRSSISSNLNKWMR